jgi:hypothetical protein
VPTRRRVIVAAATTYGVPKRPVESAIIAQISDVLNGEMAFFVGGCRR